MSIINHIGKVKFLSDKEIVAGNITRPETNDDKSISMMSCRY